LVNTPPIISRYHILLKGTIQKIHGKEKVRKRKGKGRIEIKMVRYVNTKGKKLKAKSERG
jgi:hypothetical protein